MHEDDVIACYSCSKASHHILFLSLLLTQSRLISDSDLVNLALEWTKLVPQGIRTSDMFVCMHTCMH